MNTYLVECNATNYTFGPGRPEPYIFYGVFTQGQVTIFYCEHKRDLAMQLYKKYQGNELVIVATAIRKLGGTNVIFDPQKFL